MSMGNKKIFSSKNTSPSTYNDFEKCIFNLTWKTYIIYRDTKKNYLKATTTTSVAENSE